MIPSTIERTHILQAIEKIDSEEVPNKYKSTRFDLLYEGKKYPPKYVISLAHIFVDGKQWSLKKFSGGYETNTFLNNHDFGNNQFGIHHE